MYLYLYLLLISLLLPLFAAGDKIRATSHPSIATFYPEPEFQGKPFEVQAIYNQCYNFLGKIASVKVSDGTAGCELYDVTGCGHEEGRETKSFTVIKAHWPDLKKGVRANRGTKSFKCTKK